MSHAAPPPSARHRLRRPVAAVLALAVLAVVAADVLALASRPARTHRGADLVTQDLGHVANPAAIVALADEERAQAANALLETRAHAVQTHDEATFLATVDPHETAFYARQRALYAALQRVSFAAFSYVLDPTRARARPHPQSYGDAGTWAPDVTLQYELAGFDPTPASQHLVYTFVHRGGHWLLGGDQDYAGSGAPSDRELWDFGPVAAVQVGHALVLGFVGQEFRLRALAAEVDADVPRVTAVWGTDWPQRAVVEVPADQAQFAAVTGAHGDVSQVEAVQSTEIVGEGRSQTQSGNRIVVNPGPFGHLSAAGREVVLTHELTHVASRARTGPNTPLWLVEGLADYGGFRGSGLSTATITAELRSLVRTSGIPAALPADADFVSSSPDVAAAYEEAWLACRLIAERYGTAGLVRLYTLVGTSTHSGPTALDDALKQVTGQGTAAFTAAWRAYVRMQLS